MEVYTLLREIADSWGLLSLTLIFVGVVAFAYRPGAKALHDDISRIPLRNDDLPSACEDCDGNCAGKQLAEDN